MFHINPANGAVGRCRAEKGKCPYGPIDEHFESAAAARMNYEKKMSEKPLDRSTLKSLTSDELRKVLLKEALEIGLDGELVAKAANFAKELHRGQFRSAAPWEEKPPYITHPLRNAIRLIRWGVTSPEGILGAILHDVVEDSSEKYCDQHGIKYRDPEHARNVLLVRIRKDYGDRVAHIVHKLSNPYQSSDERRAMTDEEKNSTYVNHVAESIKDDHDIFMDKLSDLHDNAASLIHSMYPGREKQTRKQALKYSLTMPVFREELARNPLRSPVQRRAAFESIVLIEDRLRSILAAEPGEKI